MVCSHTHVWWIKIREGYLGSKESQPHNRAPSSGFQCQEVKFPELWIPKTSRDYVGGRNFWSPKQFLLKNPHMDSPTQAHFLWAPAMGWWLEGHQWHTRRN